MTEKGFWMFLEKAWEKDGRVNQVSGTMDIEEQDSAGTYIGGHSVLPNGYEAMTSDIIEAMGQLLLQSNVKYTTKQAILMILAHHGSRLALNAIKQYSKNPDECLWYYAELALDECRMWLKG